MELATGCQRYPAVMHVLKSPASPMIEARAELSAVGIKPVCVRLIECRSQAAVGPGTIAGRDHREGAAGHHDPLDIVLLPTDI